jgi:hypothetical protein
MRNAMRDGRPCGASIGAALLLSLCLLASCAGKPAPKIEEPKPPEPRPTAKLESGAPIYEDQYKLSIPLTLKLANPRAEELRLESADCSLSVQGSGAGTAPAGTAAKVVEGGSELELSFEFPVDVRKLDASVSGPGGPPRASYSCRARARLVAEDGEAFDLEAALEGSFLIIRDPIFRITSLKIERDILVTTNLVLSLEVENPNDFPVELGSFDYRFFGEGKSWAMGERKGAVALPALSTRPVSLAFEMNFADRDRKLFDLVADLKVVRYGLVGQAKVSTGLPFLGEFRVKVDEEGSCQVER